MQSTEYVKVRHGLNEEKGLGADIRSVLFSSKNAAEVCSKLIHIEPRARKYWGKIQGKKKDIDTHIGYGTLPFTITQTNQVVIYDQIKKMLDRIISVDIPHSQNVFHQIYLEKFLLFSICLLPRRNIIYGSVSNDLDISRPVLINILETLEKYGDRVAGISAWLSH